MAIPVATGGERWRTGETLVGADLEKLAKRVMEFIDAAEWTVAGRGGMPAQIGVPLPTNIREHLYEECLAELTEDERGALGRIIEKMRKGAAVG